MVSKQIYKNPKSLLNLIHTKIIPPCQRRYTELCNTTKLLGEVFKAGRVFDAEKMFNEMPQRNIASWSVAIHGYSINGFYSKSMKMFFRMRQSGLFPNSFAVVGALVSTGGLRDMVLTRSIHGLIFKCGVDDNVIVSTALLDAYAKCGNICDSYGVFEQIENPSLASWNAMFSGFINGGLFKEGFLLVGKLWDSGLVPNVATVLSLIKGCVGLNMKMHCECVHGFVITLGLAKDIAVSNSVLDMYSSFLNLRSAANVFDRMEYRDIISWTIMMGLLIDLEFTSDALKLFSKMRNTEFNLDMVLFIHLISACAILGDLTRGRQVHAQVLVNGFGSDLPLSNSIISMYSKCRDLDSSRTSFDQTADKSLFSWTAMISGYVQNGHQIEALNLMRKARGELDYSLDPVFLTSAITACGELAALEYSQQLHCSALVLGFVEVRSIQNSLISAYAKCGKVDLSYLLFKEMGCHHDVVSWNAVINGYGINGYGETAVSLYHEMRRAGEDPDSATFLCVLSACSHAGLVNEGLLIFKQMIEDNNITPSQEHYGCVADLLVRSGCLFDTSEFDGKFEEEIGPNVWKALLRLCAQNGDVKLAELAAKKLSEQESGEFEHVVLLSNVYASVGRFQDAEMLRSSTQKMGFTKYPGISFINGS